MSSNRQLCRVAEESSSMGTYRECLVEWAQQHNPLPIDALVSSGPRESRLTVYLDAGFKMNIIDSVGNLKKKGSEGSRSRPL